MKDASHWTQEMLEFMYKADEFLHFLKSLDPNIKYAFEYKAFDKLHIELLIDVCNKNISTSVS